MKVWTLEYMEYGGEWTLKTIHMTKQLAEDAELLLKKSDPHCPTCIEEYEVLE